MLTCRLCTLWLLALSISTFISYFHILRIVHFQFYAFVSEMHIELLAKWFLFLICYYYAAMGLVSVHASGDFLYMNRVWVKERKKSSAFNINKDFFLPLPLFWIIRYKSDRTHILPFLWIAICNGLQNVNDFRYSFFDTKIPFMCVVNRGAIGLVAKNEKERERGREQNEIEIEIDVAWLNRC